MVRVAVLAVVLLACVCAPTGDAVTVQIPLQGFDTLFQYYTYITVGTPELLMSVTVDTGSSDLLVPNTSCKTCAGDPSKFYDPSKSATHAAVQCNTVPFHCAQCDAGNACGYNVTYGGGMYESADLTLDVASAGKLSVMCAFGSVHSITMPGAAVDAAAGYHASKARGAARAAREARGFVYPEGIWGMAFRELSAANANPLFLQLADAHETPPMFSLHLNSTGGTLTLGGVPRNVPNMGSVQWLPLSKRDFWRITMLDILVAGHSIGIRPVVYNVDAIVDSGTPYPTLPKVAFDAVRAAVVNNCSQNAVHGVCDAPAANATLFDNTCFSFTAAQQAAFPTITFVVQGENDVPVHLPFTPQYSLQAQYYCQPGELGLGLQADNKFLVIGAEMMQAFVTVHDTHNGRIGFAELM